MVLYSVVMCEQLQAAQSLIGHLNKTLGRSYSIVARPDKEDSTRPRWDYTLEDAGTRAHLGLEVTTARRSADAGGIDDMWSRVLDRVQQAAQSRVTGDFAIYTSERIFIRRNTADNVVKSLTEAIIRLCCSGAKRSREEVQTASGPIPIRVNVSKARIGLGFLRVTTPGGHLAAMKVALETLLLQKRAQLDAIIAEGLPPHLLIRSVDIGVLSPDDVAMATLEIIRDHSLSWFRAYVIQSRDIVTVDPEAGTITR